jgi:eukaryotic-like serine/threonine-protein kinase
MGPSFSLIFLSIRLVLYSSNWRISNRKPEKSTGTMPSIPIGTTFLGPNSEKFKITDFLGHGAFGEVYRAVGESSGTVVAVKLLPLGSLADPASKLTLLNEMRAAEKIKHPNVVRVLHVNDGASSAVGPYVVMEYVSDGSLAKLLRAQGQSGKPIPLNRATEMMIDIAQGAKAINEKLIHRDIKPDNVLNEGGRLKIGDFGISKFVDESTRLHTFKGAQHIWYMAPEGWENQANSIQIDVYAVGLVFYEILMLRHPLVDKVPDPNNVLDWEKAHLYQQCPDIRTLRTDVPLSIAQLLSRMVSKRPAERPYWDEVLNVLSQPEVTDSSKKNPTVTVAVEAAVARNRELQRRELELKAQQDEREKQLGLYRLSCAMLIEQLNPAVEQFNQEFQHGQIIRREEWGMYFYRIPQGQSIEVTFFEPRKSGIKIRNGEVIGGGWIGLSRGRSANLVLLKHDADDLYGHWVVCEVGLMATVDPRKIIGRFGITGSTITPFGFKDAFFYDQIQHATGIVHVFTYTFLDDVADFFANLIQESCKIGTP